MDAIKKAWVDTTYEAILTVERYLGIKGDSTLAFSSLANWVYETDISPEVFMPARWESSKKTAQGFARFLKALHQAMLDSNGKVIFVETESNGSFIVFDVPLHETSWISEAYLKRLPSFYQSSYEAHQDVERFIEHMAAFDNEEAMRSMAAPDDLSEESNGRVRQSILKQTHEK